MLCPSIKAAARKCTRLQWCGLAPSYFPVHGDRKAGRIIEIPITCACTCFAIACQTILRVSRPGNRETNSAICRGCGLIEYDVVCFDWSKHQSVGVSGASWTHWRRIDRDIWWRVDGSRAWLDLDHEGHDVELGMTNFVRHSWSSPCAKARKMRI